MGLALSVSVWSGFGACLIVETEGDVEPLAPGEATLERNPRMLCCLPIEPGTDFLGRPMDLTGVRAAPRELSPIFVVTTGFSKGIPVVYSEGIMRWNWGFHGDLQAADPMTR